MVIDERLMAAINLIGLTLGLIGGLYLAYDLLGGQRGSLRIISRALGYGLLFAFGYTPVLGLRFGIPAAIGMGVILSVELIRVSPHTNEHTLDPRLFGLLRGLALGVAAMLAFDIRLGLIFGLLTALGLVVVYSFQLSPTDTYVDDVKPNFRRVEVIAALARGTATILAGLIAALITGQDPAIGIRIGLVVGSVSLLLGIFSPVVEWRVNNLKNRQMAMMGLSLILIGFLLQSVEFWLILFGAKIQ